MADSHLARVTFRGGRGEEIVGDGDDDDVDDVGSGADSSMVGEEEKRGHTTLLGGRRPSCRDDDGDGGDHARVVVFVDALHDGINAIIDVAVVIVISIILNIVVVVSATQKYIPASTALEDDAPCPLFAFFVRLRTFVEYSLLRYESYIKYHTNLTYTIPQSQ